ncbi:hypothetical protein [Pantoea phage vB_PdeP_F2M1C]|nr:hypothetical protein [Pantoea phage vB_PdeP_F2M1C]
MNPTSITTLISYGVAAAHVIRKMETLYLYRGMRPSSENLEEHLVVQLTGLRMLTFRTFG